MSVPKSCSTCEHRSGSKCIASGFYIATERKYPTVCGREFTRWAPRMGILKRISFWLTGVNK